MTVGGTVAEGLVAAGAVGSRVCVAGGAVETVEMSRARGRGTGGATKVARLAKAGCRAAGATEVARLAEPGDCRAAGAAMVAGLVGAGCWAESPERKEAWARSPTAMAAAVGRFWASRKARRVSRSQRARVVSSSPARAVAEWRSEVVSFSRGGTSSRSCSAVARSSACLSVVVLAMWSAETRACASPSSTSWRETCFISACCAGSTLSQMGAKCPR